MNPKASVTVATDDPEKLPEALEKAKELTEELPEMEEDELDLEDMSPEQLKAKLKALMSK